METPDAGREPAATELLRLLADPGGARLCLVTGGPGRGKSTLLGRLAGHPAHAFVPLEGQSALGAAWSLAERLGVVVRDPGELVQVLTTESRQVVIVLPDLHAAQEPDALAELIERLSELGNLRLVVEARTGTPAHRRLAARRPAVLDLDQEQWRWRGRGPARYGARRRERPAVDLDDPAAVCAADPLRVTAAYAAEGGEGHGGLRAAWLRAGQSLCRDQTPSRRALVLLSTLGDGADPRLRPALEQLAAPEPWRVRWTRVRGDVTPPWPGPVAALAVGTGPLRGRLLVADRVGTVRLIHAADAAPAGRPAHAPGGRVTALAPLPDGTVLLLDERGRLHSVRGVPRTAASRPGGAGERLTEAVAATLTTHPGTALAAVGGTVVVGDRVGSVHAFSLGGVRQAAPHSGRVTAVAAVEAPEPVVYSGGADGTVRSWAPAQGPPAAPLAERPYPVVALHAAVTAEGPTLAVAWRDGLVGAHRQEAGRRLEFHPGQPVRAVAVTPDGDLVIGMDESLVCLRASGGPR
ncbi:hypothetical protein QWM81_28375 [Streptomyces ficellus]|uniref:Uncharacterized protein n=1 Tax=Streptomyces ficellus TaxID=1977088 RepID=A0ABT7ZEN6_9ACTN|nr:hypothetical protein [Streptomyces ficellus]MDN3297886.1 hypothetical protein [Streptomyces ficellus]